MLVGVLNRDEIERRIRAGQLILNARLRADGQIDIEGASYDLTAGIVVWKSPPRGQEKGETKALFYRPEEHSLPGLPVPTGIQAIRPRAIRQRLRTSWRRAVFRFARHHAGGQVLDAQPTVTLDPGQMIFVITHEDIVMPRDVVGTVYSRNSLALKGILALNAGHIDPGFEGPIVIRLINLRANAWTLALGEPIFTIVFQTLGFRAGDELSAHRAISRDETLRNVRNTADQALANALLDVYVEKLGTEFVRRDQLGWVLLKYVSKRLLSVMVFIAVLATIISAVAAVASLFGYGPGILELLKRLWARQDLGGGL
jgi:deoxycytidine triphosphate deaminase